MTKALRTVLLAGSIAAACSIYGSDARAQQAPTFPVTCSSTSYGPHTCHFGFEAASVVLSKQLSNTACVKGSTWSNTSRSVTVNGGCRGQFTVAMKSERPHVIILTDIGQDPDDHQSLIRTLLYSNDISIRGIIPTYRPNRPVGTDIVKSTLSAYDKDLPNLLKHDIRYTQTSILLGRVKDGLNSNSQIGSGRDTPGSNHIIAMVDSAPVPVWVLVWGGSRELAQALYKVKATRSASAYAAFQKKLRVYTISWSQYSNEPGDWMAANAKDMFWIASASYERTGTATFRGMYQLGDQSMQKESWIRTYIKSRGNLGALYPLNTTEDGMKEGDSPSLLHVLPIGLADPSSPKQGGWGGRYKKEDAYYNNVSKNLYTSQYVLDTLGSVTDRKISVARWRPAYQSDFAARAEWLEQSYAEANHPPEARINGANFRTVRSGSTVTLDASPSSDPDGDSLSYKWWVYKEASQYQGSVSISNNGNRVASLRAPSVSSTQDLHVILEVKDSGSPSSTRYQRVVLTVTP